MTCFPYNNIYIICYHYNGEQEGPYKGEEKKGDLETGQVASRAVPVPGPMEDPGTPAAMANQGAQAEQGAWDASMAEQGAWDVAMAEQGAWDASMVGSPPQKNVLG